MDYRRKSLLIVAFGAGIGVFAAGPAAAGSVADFYSGKTVTMIVGSGAGG